MSLGKVLLIGGVGVGVAMLFMHSAKANAIAGVPGFVPPPNATTHTFAPPLNLGSAVRALKQTSWHVAADASGQRAGTWRITQNADNGADYVVAFQADDSHSFGVVAFSQTPVGGLLAQAAAAGE